jgi:cell division septal protein FtsQ
MNPVPVYSHQTANTWREIPQVGGARPVNKTGKRRLVMTAVRFWSMTGLAVASLIIGYMALRMWRDNPGGLAGPSESVPLREIVMRSDGVLDLAWVKQTLAVKPGVGIMSLDLTELQDRLMASGQVRTAVISRRFPDVLAVVMEERSPVLRVQSQGDESARAALFVARDGTVFSGENYDEALVSSLPWLDGVSLVRAASGRGFARIDGLVPVSRSFQRVSLARFARDRVVIVGTPDVPEIVFGTHAELGFFQQLARLDYILDELRAQPGGKVVRSINLSLGGRQVPVAFEPAAPASPKSSRSSAVPSAAVSRVGQAGPSSNPYTFFRL